MEIYIQTDDFDKMMELCLRYGDKQPSLWHQNFEYCASNCKDPDQPDERLIHILEIMDKNNIFSQAEIINFLSENSKLTLGMVKPWILKTITEDAKFIRKTKSLIDNYKETTEKNKQSILEIQTNSITFQSRKCELCRQVLELPTVNFLCKHSYHSK
jgi:hypothetical protein